MRGRTATGQLTMRTRVRPLRPTRSGASVIPRRVEHPIAMVHRRLSSTEVRRLCAREFRPGSTSARRRICRGRGPRRPQRRLRRTSPSTTALPRDGRQPGRARHVASRGLHRELSTACFHAARARALCGQSRSPNAGAVETLRRARPATAARPGRRVA